MKKRTDRLSLRDRNLGDNIILPIVCRSATWWGFSQSEKISGAKKICAEKFSQSEKPIGSKKDMCKGIFAERKSIGSKENLSVAKYLFVK